MQKLQPILFRFLSIALILNGTLLLINYFKKTNPDWGDAILWIAIANLVVGFAAFFTAWKNKRLSQSKNKEDN